MSANTTTKLHAFYIKEKADGSLFICVRRSWVLHIHNVDSF